MNSPVINHGKLERTLFSHCTVSRAQVIHGSKNTISIIGFLKFLQCLRSDLSGIKAGAIKLRSPRLPTNIPWVSAVYGGGGGGGAARGLADAQPECGQSVACGFGKRLGIPSLKKDLSVKVWLRLLVGTI